MNFLTINTNNIDSYFGKAKLVMIWKITIAFILIFSTLSILNYDDPLPFKIFITSLFIFIASFFYLKIKKKADLVYWTVSIFGTLAVNFALNANLTYTHFVDFLWIMVVILISFIGLGKKVGFSITAINFMGIIFFYFFSLNTHITVLQPLNNSEIGIAITEVLFALFCIVFLLNEYWKFNKYYSQKLKKSNAQLVKKNDENFMLIKEIHHRVKNNLQIIISLLRLQKGELKSDEAKRHFNEAINRVMVMSLIHQKLYQKKDLAQIEIQSYIHDLSKDLIQISTMGIPINFEVGSEIKKIGLKTIVPLGLLINELISNSIKHAFKKEGFITISVLKGITPDDFILIYKDDGTWNEPKDMSQCFGLGLIEILTEQLDGYFDRQQSEYTFNLRNLEN
ncbi:MAG: sensor histidine kinase [Vicingaceae bacterium]